MEIDMHKIGIFLNENSDSLKKRITSSRDDALKFLDVCEEQGMVAKVCRQGSRQSIPYGELPDEVLKSLAVQMFDHFRRQLMS